MRAIALATTLHRGQVDKAGKPYIEHPLRVMQSVEGGETEKTVAVLHDVLEDTPITYEDLRREFGETVADAVKALSRNDGEDYFDFIKRLKSNAIAVSVKRADLKDNMDLSRLTHLTEQDMMRYEKYARALAMLESDW